MFLYAGGSRKIQITADPGLPNYFNNGNVGIGTTAPPYKLSVKGTVGANEVIVTNTSGWPGRADYPPVRELWASARGWSGGGGLPFDHASMFRDTIVDGATIMKENAGDPAGLIDPDHHEGDCRLA